MTLQTETNDQNGNIIIGDTFAGAVGGSDTRDNIYMSNLVVGETYTISIDLSAISGTMEFAVLNPFTAEGSRLFIVDGTFYENSVQNSSIGTFSPGTLNGTTISFEFTPSVTVTYQFEITAHGGNAFEYAVSLSEYVAPPVLNEITGSGQVSGSDMADLITGSIGDDKINAHDGDDEIHGGAGKDVLTGHGGDDLIYGGTGNDNLYGREGNDTLDGGANNDKLMGGDGDDLLLGGDGNDKLWGDAGNDTLNGGTGKDDLTGGTGADVFVFDSSSKIGRIMDFEDGIDQIDLTGLADAGITRFDMLSLVQSGSMAIVSLSGSNRIELMNTDITDLDASDFIF